MGVYIQIFMIGLNFLNRLLSFGATFQMFGIWQGLSGSLLDTILHLCYNKVLIKIKNDDFHMAPNMETVMGQPKLCGVSVLAGGGPMAYGLCYSRFRVSRLEFKV